MGERLGLLSGGLVMRCTTSRERSVWLDLLGESVEEENEIHTWFSESASVNEIDRDFKYN